MTSASLPLTAGAGAHTEEEPDWKGAHWYPGMAEIREALPGFFLVVLPITVIAELLWTLEIHAKQQFFVDIFMGAVLAVLVGNVVAIPERLQPGLVFSTKWFLRAGIIIYGLKFSYKSLEHAGVDYLAVVLVSVIPAIAVALILGRALRVPAPTAALIGTGTAICGVAAAMATAPSVRARAEQVGIALAGILFWGTLGLFIYPYIGHALHLSNSVYGAWSGAAIHDLPQIVAAAKQGGGSTGLEYALLVKLIRVAFIVVIIFFMSVYFTVKDRDALVARGETSVSTSTMMAQAVRQFPLFVGAFFAVVMLNTFIQIPKGIAGPLATYPASKSPITVAGVFLTFAIVGIGARVTRTVVSKAGPRPMLLALFTWVIQSVLVLITAQALLPHLK